MNNNSKLKNYLQIPIEKCVEEFKTMEKQELSQVVQGYKIMYQQTSNMKDSLLMVKEKGEVPVGDIEDFKTTTTNLYTALQLIEDRHNVAESLLNTLMKDQQTKVNKISGKRK